MAAVTTLTTPAVAAPVVGAAVPGSSFSVGSQELPGIGKVTLPGTFVLPGDSFTISGTFERGVADTPRVAYLQELTAVGWKKVAAGRTGRNGTLLMKARVKPNGTASTMRVVLPTQRSKVGNTFVSKGAVAFPNFTLGPQTVALAGTVPDIATLKSKAIATATMTPAKPGVTVLLQQHTIKGWKPLGRAVTKADGTVSLPFAAAANDTALYRFATASLNRSGIFFSPVYTAKQGSGSSVPNDADFDGLTDGEESLYNTLRTKADSDNDGIIDGDEVDIYGSDPRDNDSDGDGLTDGFEVEIRTNPINDDTDGDFALDRDEWLRPGMTPLRADTDADGDGLFSGEERYYGTSAKFMDTDVDGDDDGFEIAAGTNPLRAPEFTDTDEDGLLDDDESAGSTDPNNPDTDGDGLSDYDEVTLARTNPDVEDTDSDGLNDYLEVYFAQTSPLVADTDGGGVEDGLEVAAYLDPLLDSDDYADVDGDTILSIDEVALGSDPRKRDTDADDLRDDVEGTYGTDPANPDTDADGLKDGIEAQFYLTDPTSPDTDGDGVDDGTEIKNKTNPKDASEGDPATTDTDGDGLFNAEETDTYKTNPGNPDTDGDGLTDYAEVNTHLTDPTKADTDKDGLKDGVEVNDHGTNPAVADSDGDGLKDGVEVNTRHTDPLNTDSDGDGFSDGDEATKYGTDPTLTDSDSDGVTDADEIPTAPMGPDNIDLLGKDAYSWAATSSAKKTRAMAVVVNDLEYLNGTDTDGDGLKDYAEVNYLTDKNNPDTDGDGVSDGDEALVYKTHPRLGDTDKDGVGDADEVGPAKKGGYNVDLDPFDPFSWAVPLNKRAEAVAAGVNDQAYLTNADANKNGTPDYLDVAPPDPNQIDTDGDGLKDGQETTLGTDKTKADTDGDGANDGNEVNVYGTNPLNPDTDSDGVLDGIEAGPSGVGPTSIDLDPKDAFSWAIPSGKKAAAQTAGVNDGVYYNGTDTDNDGLKDYEEVLKGTSKTTSDTDGDGVSDGSEVNAYGTDPLKTDTDNDGLSDGVEAGPAVYGGLNIDLSPLDDYSWAVPSNKRAAAVAAGVNDKDYKDGKDTDGDGLKDYEEVINGTSKTATDTDNDGLSDGAEVNLYSTNPKNPDTDGDGLTDGYEVNTSMTDPKSADGDGDGLSDGVEINTYGTNPKKADTDNDGLGDAAEVNIYTTDPKVADTDADTLSDGIEVNTYTTDPKKADTDGDTLRDDVEVGPTLVGPLNVDLDPKDAYSWANATGKKTQAQSASYLVNDAVYKNLTDTDGELLPDYREVLAGTSKTVQDTDSDLVNDYVEVVTDGTDPLDFLDRKHVWTKVSSGGSHACGLDSSQKLYCWGRNNNGQLGLGNTTDSTRPYPVQQAWNWTAVSAGANSTCAVRSTGALYCWGLNTNGQLGTGNTTSQNTPTQVGTATNWTSVDVSNTHACGIQGNNTQIQCWGLNANGQIGDNSVTQRTAPAGGIYTNVVQLNLTASSFGAGASHTCAVSGGTMYCTGLNTNGQVGDNTNTQRQQYTTTGTNGWSTVSSASSTSCGVKSPGASGTLWCWGANANNQVGDGTAADRKAPTQIATAITGWSSVDVGTTSACAIRSIGTLYCWGANANGQFGNGTTTGATSPTQIGTVSTWSSVSAGTGNACAIRTDNTLYCWGDNTYGQIGNNTVTASTSPVLIK